jgi:hypothetical protein
MIKPTPGITTRLLERTGLNVLLCGIIWTVAVFGVQHAASDLDPISASNWLAAVTFGVLEVLIVAQAVL